jgi:DNA-binding HxlR family transcriptional regulator
MVSADRNATGRSAAMDEQGRPNLRLNCPIADTLGVIGDRWTLLILRDALVGVTRFEQFQSRLGISRSVLTTRLKHLLDAGLLDRKPLHDDGRRQEYVLTEKGQAMLPVLAALVEWGETWMPQAGGPRARIVDRHSGDPVSLRFCRDSDGAMMPPAAVRLGAARPGDALR